MAPETVRVHEACCESKTCPIEAKHDEESAHSSCCNDSISDAVCSGTCCDATDEKAADTASACSQHLQSAFERFESLIRLGQCLCQQMIEEFDFCCCCGQNFPCPSRVRQTDHAVKVTEVPNASWEDASCASGKAVKKRSPPYKEPCAAGKTAGRPSFGCKDLDCATTKTSGVSEFAAITPPTDGAINIDIEKAKTNQDVAINVSGMTCTGCSKKMLNVLRDIPGVSNPYVTFVSNTAAFDFDTSKGHPDEVLPLIEKRTGFKLSRLTAGFHELDVLLDVAKAQAYEGEKREGLVSLDKLKVKDKYRITYDPQVAGARSVMPAGAKLLPPAPDAANLEGRKRLINMAWDTLVSIVFTIPVVVLSWSDNPVPHQTRQIISLVLATLVQAIAIPEFYVGAIKYLVFSKIIEMDMLVVISITAACAYSVIAFALAEANIELEQAAFFETSSLLITLVLVGRLMVAIARMRAVSAVSMSSLQTDTALLLHDDGQTEEIDARLVQFGDIIRVSAHTSIVTDGIVVPGSSAVDEAMLTGESDPVTKVKGDVVVAGTLNGPSILDVRITRLPNANSVSDIKNIVNNALGSKPKIQDLADKVASWFIPAVVAISLVTFGVWLAIAFTIRNENGGGAVGTAITYAIAVLAISCPCALGLAVPMVLVIAGGAAARSGVVVKSVDALQRGYKATDILFDKTGTLTLDGLAVVREHVHPSSSIAEKAAVGLANGLVMGNNHPVSGAISRHLEDRSAPSTKLEAVESIPGSGIQGRWEGRRVKTGNPHWLGVTNDPAVIEILEQRLTAFCVSVDGELLLSYCLRSTIRDEALAVVAALHRRNLRCHIVSGDHEKAVREVAAAVGIPFSNVVARCTPTQKKEYVQELQSNGRIVLFCGDGTKDAVAVAQANVVCRLAPPATSPRESVM